MHSSEKKAYLYILLSSFLFFIFGNWILSLTSLDEGRNFYATLHMLKTGNFVIPEYNCSPRFEKPPLLYWLGALSFLVFGASEFSARLVSGLSATLTAFLVYLFSKEFLTKEKALFSALSFTLLIHTWIESRAYVPEFTLVFFSTLGLYLLMKERFTLAWLSLAFAFLTKGPVGLLPLFIYLLWKRNLSFIELKGIILFLVVGFSWYFLMIYLYGWSYFFKFFIYENLYRFTGKYELHPMPFYFYPLIILFSSLLFIPLIPKIIKNYDRRLNFFLLWFFAVVIFYSLSKNKLHHYILFSYPPLSVIFGNYITKNYLKKVYAVALILFSLLLFGANYYESKRFTPKAVEYLKETNPKNLYFYKHENSAIVAYLYKCIPKKEKFSKGDYLITKEKHLKNLKNYEIILKGIEFEGREVLVRIR
ncbi:glycosyltransferase family 39 protein [Aquifex pyrophilus]